MVAIENNSIFADLDSSEPEQYVKKPDKDTRQKKDAGKFVVQRESRNRERSVPNGIIDLASITEKNTDKPEKQIPSQDRNIAPEASMLHGAVHHQEHIGQVLLTAESSDRRNKKEKPLVSASESSTQKLFDNIPEQLRSRHIETMNRSDLLFLSEKIIIDGSNLRQIYDTHLVGEHGLRRLIIVYLEGGDLRKALRQEITEHEIDFERDPALRDMALSSIPTSSHVDTNNVDGTSALSKLLEKATAGMGEDQGVVSYSQKSSAGKDNSLALIDSRRRLLNIAMVLTIAILVVLVMILLMTRS